MKKVFRKFLSVLLVTEIIFSFSSVAHAASVTGTYENLKYEIVDGEAVITDCDASAAGTVEVPSVIDGYTVTKIGDEAFEECFYITAIILPNTINYIGFKAFTRTAIKEFVVPDSITVLKYRTFDTCKELEKVVLPEGLTEIEYSAFSGCSKLSEVNIPASVNKIGSSAFNHTALTSVTIPEGVTSLVGVFDSCKSLAEVNLPASLTEIGRSCFYSCSSLTTIDLPENLQTIGYSAFYFCEALTEIDIPSSVTLIDEYAFFECTSLAGSVVIPDGITEIKMMSFYNTEITDLYITSSVTSIGNNAFGQCSSLENIYYSGNIEAWNNVSIGTGSSYVERATIHYNYSSEINTLGSIEYVISENEIRIIGCDPEAQGEIDIPSEIDGFPVTVIDKSAFENCTGVISVSIPSTVNRIYSYAFSKSGITEITIPEGIEVLAERTFYSCSELADVNLPTSLKTIERNAFSWCEALEYIEIPASVETIGDWAFSFAGLKSVVVPDGITVLNGTFSNCELVTAILPESLTVIGPSTFFSCRYLEKVNMPKNLTVIGESAFSYCRKLKEINIPSTVTQIGSFAFNTCIALSGRLTLPDALTEISHGAFGKCIFDEVIIPSGITTISADAFAECLAVNNVFFCGTEDEWNSINVESGNEFLTSAKVYYDFGRLVGDCGKELIWIYDVGNRTLEISGIGKMDEVSPESGYGWDSFKNELEYVSLKNGVETVASNAFIGCPNIKEVYLSNSLETVGEYAFADCPSLAVVTIYSTEILLENNSFTNNDDRLTFVHHSMNEQAAEYAAGKNAKTVPFIYNVTKEAMCFKGEFVVYEDLGYNLLAEFAEEKRNMKYLFFEKLVFDGVTSDIIDIEEVEGAVADEEYLTFKNLYISISAVRGDGEESITFSQLIEMLESGDHEGFLIEIESDRGKESVDFMRALDHFVTSALKMVSKLINLISKIFKR